MIYIVLYCLAAICAFFAVVTFFGEDQVPFTKNKNTVAFSWILFGAILAASGGSLHYFKGAFELLQGKVASATTEMNQTQSQLAAAQQELDQRQASLAAIHQRLAQAQSSLKDATSQRLECASRVEKLDKTVSDVKEAATQVDEAFRLLGTSPVAARPFLINALVKFEDAGVLPPSRVPKAVPPESPTAPPELAPEKQPPHPPQKEGSILPKTPPTKIFPSPPTGEPTEPSPPPPPSDQPGTIVTPPQSEPQFTPKTQP